MAIVYIDVKGPKSIGQLIAVVEPSARPLTDGDRGVIKTGAKGLQISVEFEGRGPWPYTADIEGDPDQQSLVHARAARMLRKMTAKGWKTCVVPDFSASCVAEVDCPVCNNSVIERLGEDSATEWAMLADTVVAAVTLDESLRVKLYRDLEEGPPEKIVMTAVLASRTPLPAYVIAQIRHFVSFGPYAVDERRKLVNALDRQLRENTERQVVERSIASDLAAVVDLAFADRCSLAVDLDAGDYESVLFDGVLNAQERLPRTLIARIRAVLERGWFDTATTTDLDEALKWHESIPYEADRDSSKSIVLGGISSPVAPYSDHFGSRAAISIQEISSEFD